MGENRLLFTALNTTSVNKKQKTIIDSFLEQLKESDSLDIVVGYCSKASLEKLDELISQTGIKNICLVLGMYYIEGFPKSIYEKIVELNEKWRVSGIGEIRLIHSFKDHSKYYCFYKNKKPISVILGSANFSFLEGIETKSKQYEMAALFKNQEILEELSPHINWIKEETNSKNISYLEGIRVIEGETENLEEIGREVTEPPKEDPRDKKVITFKSRNAFYITLRVPSEIGKFSDSKAKYTKSNLNVCYGPSQEKTRSWWEVQITVSEKIIRKRGYPKREEWFYVITDDGKWFKAKAEGKQFIALEDEYFLGRWIKGRLVSKGLIKPIEDLSLDLKKEGVITKEMLDKYGTNKLVLMNTGTKEKDKEGVPRSVWCLSFSAKN